MSPIHFRRVLLNLSERFMPIYPQSSLSLRTRIENEGLIMNKMSMHFEYFLLQTLETSK